MPLRGTKHFTPHQQRPHSDCPVIDTQVGRLSVVDAAAVAQVEGDDDEFSTPDIEDYTVVAYP